MRPSLWYAAASMCVCLGVAGCKKDSKPEPDKPTSSRADDAMASSHSTEAPSVPSDASTVGMPKKSEATLPASVESLRRAIQPWAERNDIEAFCKEGLAGAVEAAQGVNPSTAPAKVDAEEWKEQADLATSHVLEIRDTELCDGDEPSVLVQANLESAMQAIRALEDLLAP